MAEYNVEQALSFGVQKREGLWKIEYLHPKDAGKKIQVYVPADGSTSLVGKKIDEIYVAEPGARLKEVIGWLSNQIKHYPFYWYKEGTYVDKFGYDFQVSLDANDKTSQIEISQISYEIVKKDLGVKELDSPERNVDIAQELVEGGGVLTKIVVTLAYPQPVSEFSIGTFTKYPLQLESLMYEQDIESYHPLKEIILNGSKNSQVKMTQSSHTIRVQFPAITAKRITFILRQRNYELNSYLINSNTAAGKALWGSLTTIDTDTAKGAEAYLAKLASYQKELLTWQKEVDIYKQKLLERKEKLQEKASSEAEYQAALSEYREEYTKAIQKYKTQLSNFQEDSAAYKAYEKEVTVYNNYLRELAEWKSKWS